MDTLRPMTLTVTEMAEVLKIGRNKAYELINKDQIRYIKIGKQIRIPIIVLEEWLQSQCS